MTSYQHVFFDPTGRRRKLALVVVALLIVLVAAWLLFGWILLRASPLLTRHESREEVLQPIKAQTKISSDTIWREALRREIAESSSIAKKSSSYPVTTRQLAFFSHNEGSPLEIVKRHGDVITEISPGWIRLNELGTGFVFTDLDPEITPSHKALFSEMGERSLTLMPRITDRDTQNNGEIVQRFLSASTAVHDESIALLINFLQEHELPGVIFDFRDLTQQQHRALLQYTKRLRARLQVLHKKVGIVLYADDPLRPQELEESTDFLTVVATGSGKSYKPLLPLTFLSDQLQRLVQKYPSHRIIVAFSSDGIFFEDANAQGERPHFFQLLSRLGEVSLQFESDTSNTSFSFMNQSRRRGGGWLTDAAFAFNAKKIALQLGISSFGVWNVGGEDPGLWELLREAPRKELLERIPPLATAVFQGSGDIITLADEARDGERKLGVDLLTGFITTTSYKQIPSSITVTRSGYRPKSVALTFDDGPSDPYTEQVLDILKEQGIKATFFMLGEHILEHPAIVKRVLDEGHDIGNHTYTHPDLSLVSKERAILELNAAQRALQSVTGRITTLFRPPYISELSPLSASELNVMTTARDLGYVTIGISTNGRDWVLEEERDGESYERTGADVAREILDKASLMQGNAILLHDGPKNRENSVAALPLIISELRAKGYSFVTTHELLGQTAQQVMPRTETGTFLYHKIFLLITTYSSIVFSTLFIVIIVLGVIRFGILLVCSILSYLEETKRALSSEQFDTLRDVPVSIVIAAYNEESVIALTLESIRNSNHRAYEVIVSDDGSRDKTPEIVAQYAARDPRIKLLRQQNGGKASALNHAIQYASHEIIVSIDADTQFVPDAITHFVKHFNDPGVGAVAGNIKVGNRRGILTHWQSMEYITNISIGRRGFDYLHAITVVAGASGAFRASALSSAGMYQSDTLAEDMELTWRLHKHGWRIVNEPQAIGFTEAPESIRGLYKQRFRWFYGTLQCLWKHRSLWFTRGWFGWLGVPSTFLFGTLLELLSPLADLKMIFVVFSLVSVFLSEHTIIPGTAEYYDTVGVAIASLALYLVFFGVELATSLLAFFMERESMKPLWLLFFQRFAYRQLMYVVAWRATWKAFSGWKQSWGVLQRTGSVSLDDNS
jgi:poly-beta-1,6 N-acetyl-D-glucosamine synthase